LSHRAWRTASLVAFAIYFVFFAVSSVLLEDAAVVAATMAEAEFTAGYIFAVFGAVARLDSWFFGLPNVTVVQSWQSGALCSGLLYLFFDMARSIYTIT